MTASLEELRQPAHLQKHLNNLQRVYGHVFVDMGLVDPSGMQVAEQYEQRLWAELEEVKDLPLKERQ